MTGPTKMLSQTCPNVSRKDHSNQTYPQSNTQHVHIWLVLTDFHSGKSLYVISLENVFLRSKNFGFGDLYILCEIWSIIIFLVVLQLCFLDRSVVLRYLSHSIKTHILNDTQTKFKMAKNNLLCINLNEWISIAYPSTVDYPTHPFNNLFSL